MPPVAGLPMQSEYADKNVASLHVSESTWSPLRERRGMPMRMWQDWQKQELWWAQKVLHTWAQNSVFE